MPSTCLDTVFEIIHLPLLYSPEFVFCSESPSITLAKKQGPGKVFVLYKTKGTGHWGGHFKAHPFPCLDLLLWLCVAWSKSLSLSEGPLLFQFNWGDYQLWRQPIFTQTSPLGKNNETKQICYAFDTWCCSIMMIVVVMQCQQEPLFIQFSNRVSLKCFFQNSSM